MTDNLYETLGVDKTASQDEIKKAYRKQAMKYHPDKNKGDTVAEKKFKDINSAYQTLSDTSKRKQYDTFWAAGWGWWNPFSWAWSTSWGFSGFEDIFWGFWWSQSRGQEAPEKPVSLDFEKTYEVPVFDMILWCKIEVSWVYWQKAKLTIPEGTKSGSKFRVKEFWKSEWSKKWNLIIKVEAKMPKNISDVDKQMLERIRENVGY